MVVAAGSIFPLENHFNFQDRVSPTPLSLMEPAVILSTAISPRALQPGKEHRGHGPVFTIPDQHRAGVKNGTESQHHPLQAG